MIYQKIKHCLELIKFSHSIFALPFALAAFFVSSRGNFIWMQLVWIIVCVISARTSAMAFNRLADAKFDAKNPRTCNRHLPAGLLSRQFVIAFTLLSALIFIASAGQLNRLSLLLSPVALAILFFYSLSKRWTHFTQLFLGLSLGIAPIGAYIATQGKVGLPSIILGLAVLLWVAGFDLLYALQDLEFDKKNALYSLPVKLGTQQTLQLSTLLHVLFWITLPLYGYLENLNYLYYLGTLIVGAILFYEHRIVEGKLDKIDAAFFASNGLLSILFFLFVLADIFFLA